MTANDQYRHEFKNHLGIVIGFAELLIQECAPDDPRRADLEEMHKAAMDAFELLARVFPPQVDAP